MKILITGKTSYIGTNICKYLTAKDHSVEMVSVRNGANNIDFSNVDVVIHCAAIVHKKEKEYANLYESINYNLTMELAKKAKQYGVKQFIFLSTMAVYGNIECISKNTNKTPVTLYGKTKLKAEVDLKKLQDNNFNITIIRPPMVYGKNCPGNYNQLSKLAKLSPIFPFVKNKKSIIYIENLVFFISSLAENNIGGTYMPMDNKYVSTTDIAKSINNKIVLSKLLGLLVNIFKNINIIRKAFGSCYYDESCATKIDYIEFEKGIEYTEK